MIVVLATFLFSPGPYFITVPKLLKHFDMSKNFSYAEKITP